MTSPRTVRDLIANLSMLDPDMEVAAVEDHDIVGTGADLRTVAAFVVSASGPVGDGERTDLRSVLILVPSGGVHAAMLNEALKVTP